VIPRVTALGIALMAMIGIPAQAEADDDFSSPGVYLGAAGALGFDNYDFGPWDVNVDVAGGFDSWVGFRLIPNLAVEVEFGYLNGFEMMDLLEYDALVLTGNLKGYILTGRVQPFVVAGVGMTHLRGKNLASGASANDEDFAARFGGGIDYYLTENLAVQVKATYVLNTDDLDNFDHADCSFGVQLRF